MPTLKQIIFISVLLLSVLLHPIAAQDKPAVQGTLLTITAAASGERVRIAAPSSVVQMHLEVCGGSQ